MTLLFAIIAVTLALGFYTASVLGELKRKKLTKVILILFWLGLFFDVLGTFFMFNISAGFSMNFHSFIGLLALFLMAIKACWSSFNFSKGNEKRVPVTYTLSVWAFWVIVFVSGIFIR